MSQPVFPQFVNFLAASRKAALIPFNYFSPNDSISWIAAIASTGGNQTPVELTGTIDGVNAAFTVPTTIITGVSVYRNGVLQDPNSPNSTYALVGQTVTFGASFIPQPGDSLQAIVS